MTQTTACPQCGDALQTTVFANGAPALVCDGCTFSTEMVITTPVTAAQITAAAGLTSPAILNAESRILVPENRLAFLLGSWEGDAEGLAAELNAR